MYNEQIESLIHAALADGVLTEKEKQILFKKAQSMGIDLDEFEMVLDARLVEVQKAEKEKAAQSAPKSNKYGDVKKCPACGAIVQAYRAKCQECGYEFSNVDANLSSQRLAQEVLNAKSIEQKSQIITLFPIPNTKSDLLEFLTSLQPKMRDINDPLASAYFKKYQECISKAKVSFSDDEIIKPFINSFEDEKKKYEKEKTINNVKGWYKRHRLLAWIGIIFLIMAIGAMIESVTESEKNSYRLCKNTLTDMINRGDLSSAEHLISEYTGDYISDLYGILIQAYIDKSHFMEAMRLADEYKSKKAYKAIYDYLIGHDEYDKAESYIPHEYYNVTNSEYYKYIKDCIESMCKKGEKTEATKFLKRKIIFFPSEDNSSSEFSASKVAKDMNAIIETY